MEKLALFIFVLTYIGLAFGSIPGLLIDRSGIALIGASATILFGILSPEEAIKYIDISTILLLYGLMVISAQLRIGGFYTKISLLIIRKISSPGILLLNLMATSAIMSAFLANDIVCLAFTPVVAYSTLKGGLNPLPFLLGLAISSNIGSAATIVGNPQNMLIGQFAKLDFLEFFIWCFPPSFISFWIAYLIILLLFSKKWFISVDFTVEQTWNEFNKHHSLKGLIFVLITVLFFFTSIPREITATTSASLLMLSRYISTRRLLELVDWSLIIMFICLFIIIGAISKYDFPNQMIYQMQKYGLDIGNNPFHLSLASVVLSNIFSNVPAVMLIINMIPKGNIENYYILAVSSTFAGNLLTIGSIANIIVIEQSKIFDIKITFWDYARVGVIVTFTSIAVLLLWVFVS